MFYSDSQWKSSCYLRTVCESQLWSHETDMTPGIGGINQHKTHREVNVSGRLCFGVMGDKFSSNYSLTSFSLLKPKWVHCAQNHVLFWPAVLGQVVKQRNKLQAIKSPRFQGKTNQIISTSLEVQSRRFLSAVILYAQHWPAMTSKADRNQSKQVFYQSWFWWSTNKPTGLNHLADVKLLFF